MWFAVLGLIDVRDDEGVSLAPTAPRLLSLLAVLLCRQNQTVSPARLVDLVWDGRPSRSAHTSLQVYVHRLRQALGEHRVLREASGYRLSVAPDEFDVVCFSERVRTARLLRQQGEAGRAARSFADALRYWRSEIPYQGLPDSESVRGERARLSELRMSVLEWMMESRFAAGEDAGLVDELRGLVDRYPYRQRFQAQLMLALQRAGRPEEALAAYDQAAEALVESYGLEPGPPLRGLRERIRQRPTDPGMVDDWAALPVPERLIDDLFDGQAPELSAGLSVGRSVGMPAEPGDGSPGPRSGTGTERRADHQSGGQADDPSDEPGPASDARSQAPPVDTAGDVSGGTAGDTAGDLAGDTVGDLVGAAAEGAAGERAVDTAGETAGDAARDAAGVPAPDVRLVGREREATLVRRHLSPPSDRSPGTPVVAIAGQGGVGKSALARSVAHELADQFPDGQLYVNLRGGAQGQGSPSAVEPIDALARLLTDLGEPPNAVPGFEDEAAARFRSLTTGRRILVVLDDAYDASQVRPLLPGAHGPAVLVTSRRALTALDDTEVVTLAPLSRRHAIELLRTAVGDVRVAADPDAAAAVARLSGGLPLAVRIVGARLVAHQELTLGTLAARLQEGRGQLDEWEHAEVGVRASFALGYQALTASAAWLFDLLGVLELPEVQLPLLVAVTGSREGELRRRLDELVDARLLTPVPGTPERFGLHDLLRAYARERADARVGTVSTSSARACWIRRAVHFYIATARAATDRFTAMAGRRRGIGIGDDELTVSGLEFADSAAAVAWTRTETDNLIAVMRLACALPAAESGTAAGLAAALTNPLYVQASYRSLIELNRLASKAVSAGPDPGRHTVIERDLASAYLQIGQPAEALAAYRNERDGCEVRGDQYGMAVAMQGIGLCLQQLPGELPAAAAAFEEALRLHLLIDNPIGQGSALNNLANLRQEEGDLESARELYEEACAVLASTGERGRLATARANLAEVHQQAGRLEEAAAAYARTVTELRAAGYSRIEMARLWDLGDVLHQLGRTTEARQRWRQALELAATLGVLATEQVKYVLSAPTPVRPRALRAT